jgi:transcription-repair coupling factor (superfamily II helicase)
MDVPEIISRYREGDVRTTGILEQIRKNPRVHLHLKGIPGSLLSMIATAVYQEIGRNHLFIMNDKEEAAYFLNDLQTLLPGKDIHFLPDSFRKPGTYDEADTNNVLQRTESVNRLLHSQTRGELLVSYPEAIPEKVVRKEELERSTLFIKKDEKLDSHFIIDVLMEHGFVRSDFVYEPGQFSVRGGIIDIYSFGNELPYRIELFDDLVESIRVFEPITQLSQKNVAQITIVPNMQTQFTETVKTNLFNCLPDDTIIWFRDAQYTGEVFQHYYDNALAWYSIMEKSSHLHEQHPFAHHDPEALLATEFELHESLQRFPLIEFGLTQHLSDAHTIDSHALPQPLFNRNFELLLQNLNGLHAEGYQIFLFVTHNKQVERFHQIFQDLKAGFPFQAFAYALSGGFIDHDQKIACYTDHQIFERHHKYQLKSGYGRKEAISVKELLQLQPGDFVTHIDHGVGIYAGLEKIDAGGKIQEAVRLKYKDGDLLYVNINSLHKISKYAGKEGNTPKLNKLGSDAWENLKRKAKKQVKDIAKDLIALYAKRKASKGFAFSPDSYLQTELEASFIYEDTADQEKSTADVKKDMERSYPMDRLVCGDVGFGKTEIAVRAAFKAVADGKQVAVLVPTTILASQHYRTFSERLKDFPCRVDYINRFKTSKQKKESLEALKAGRTDILIGTHSIIGKTVEYKDLGLLILDEEQKFGVAAKEKLRNLKASIDTLTLTATPIPRTLQFSLMGARDLSIINTPPPNRQPVSTELKTFDAEFIRDAIYFEIYRNGQVYFVHNRVRDIEEVARLIRQVCPDVKVGVAHGQMDGDELEDHMVRFIDKDYDVLVCTNIVESGLDIPNANTIIINNAHFFGLSDLHQLRGRVGRSNRKAYCYLISPPLHNLPDDSRKRLRTIEQFAELGSGFHIAMRDLDIRGAGNLLGAEQSGFITDIGYDTYHKILDEAIRELKQTAYKELFADQLQDNMDYVKDVQIDSDLEMLIPDHYINNIAERMAMYTRLDNVQDEAGLEAFRVEMNDRFGRIPEAVEELFNAVRLRWVAKELGFERIVFKLRKLRCYFPENQDSAFYESSHFHLFLQYIAQQKATLHMKQTDKHLLLAIDQVHSMEHARKLLEKIRRDLKNDETKIA